MECWNTLLAAPRKKIPYLFYRQTRQPIAQLWPLAARFPRFDALRLVIGGLSRLGGCSGRRSGLPGPLGGVVGKMAS